MGSKKVNNCIIDLKTTLGKGTYGSVHPGTDLTQNKKNIAVKMVQNRKGLEADIYEQVFKESEVLKQIKGEHIIEFYDFKMTDNFFYIFMEYCNGGTLEDLKKVKKIFPEEEALRIINQIVSAFIDLADVTLMHRDIKPANILFHDDKLKVADFGFSKIIKESEKNLKKDHTQNLGTPLYMSPELLNDEPYSPKCDVWSAGVMFYELLTGRLPWTGYSIANIYRNIKTKPDLKFPSDIVISDDTKNLLRLMLKFKDEERISWKEISEHPAIRKFKIDEVTKKEETDINMVNMTAPPIADSNGLQIQKEGDNSKREVNGNPAIEHVKIPCNDEKKPLMQEKKDEEGSKPAVPVVKDSKEFKIQKDNDSWIFTKIKKFLGFRIN